MCTHGINGLNYRVSVDECPHTANVCLCVCDFSSDVMLEVTL